jgi:hypothetical protein
MTDWTWKPLGPITSPPNVAAIRRNDDGSRELHLAGPLGYVLLNDVGVEDLIRLLAEHPAEGPGETET